MNAADLVKHSFVTVDSFLELLKPNKLWKHEKTSGTIKVYSRPSNCLKNDKVLKAEFLLDCSPEQAFSLVVHRNKYRHGWDTELEKLEILQAVDKEKGIYLIRHVTRQVLKVISRRDSVDLCQYGQTKDCYFVAAGSISHADYPPLNDAVRAKTYPCGHAVFRVPGQPSKCQFVMMFHADINMNSIGSFIVEMLKPQLIIMTASNIIQWLHDNDMDEAEFVKKEDVPWYQQNAATTQK